MSTGLASPVRERATQRTLRPLAIGAIGPLTAVGGLVWAVAQPYRLTLLHPGDAGFWELLVQPPLLVVAVGILFALVVAPGLLEDLERSAPDGVGPRDDAAAR